MKSSEKIPPTKLKIGTIFKVLSIILLVFIVVSGMLFVNYQAILKAKHSIISLVDHDLSEVTRNAAIGRALNHIAAEAAHLIHTFSKQEVWLETEKAELVEKLRDIDTSFSSLASDKSRVFIKAYAENVEQVLVHCEKIDRALKAIRKLDREIEAQLFTLDDFLADQEMMLIAEGSGKYFVQKVSRMLPTYHGYSAWLSNRIYRLNQIFIATEQADEKEKQVILGILDDFDTDLIDLTISGAVFADIGRQIRNLLFSYHSDFLGYHALLKTFQPLYVSMNRSQEKILSISEEMSEKTQTRSKNIKEHILKNFSYFVFVSTSLFILFNTLSAALCFFILRLFKIRQLARDLRNALDEINVLQGILPICASCKKIRDDQGYWVQVEAYIHKHTEAQFSHGICPECTRKLYPDIDIEDDDGFLDN